MNPTTRYELRPGEWRADPPRVSYGSDRSGLVAVLGEELRASAWSHGESGTGPTLDVRGRTLACPATEEDLEWLASLATPAPYGRGEETLLDTEVRDALQIGANDVRLGTTAWDQLQAEMLRAVAAEMGLEDAALRLEPLKLLIYRAGGHFTEHADTEKAPGMIASLALILPREYEGGALVVEHSGDRIQVGDGGSSRWRWVAWYADCRHWLEPVRDGVRLAMTFGVAVDAKKPLTRRELSDHRLGWILWGRSYAEWHTEWAARGSRTNAGNEQYGQKLVWVLSHRYTEPGLCASLLKGRDRELARLLVDEPHGEACYLGWLQIRETGSARTEPGVRWGDDEYSWDEVEEETDSDPPPESVRTEDRYWGPESGLSPVRLKHRDTPELHLHNVARQNAWVEGLRSLKGEAIDHGPIEVLDGEIAPPGALAHAAPTGGRVYEATGNEGASLELQYRHAVLVMWRRDAATLRMLARCGGRLALSVEFAERGADKRGPNSREGDIESVLALWREALSTDGGEPEPRAHRLILEALQREDDGRNGVWWKHLQQLYIDGVAAVDLDAVAVPTLLGWIGESLEKDAAMDVWVRALRPALGGEPGWDTQGGAPALLRALCETPRGQALAIELLAERWEPPSTPEAVLREADRLEEAVLESQWRLRRRARMTSDE